MHTSRKKSSYNASLYPMVNLIPEIKSPYWKVSQLSILPGRTQVLRAITSPLTREILEKAESTIKYRKFYEEQLCEFYNHGLAFVNHILPERIAQACWYVYALQLKCSHAERSDFFVPHHLFIEMSLHRKPQTSWFAKKIKKPDGVVSLIPFHEDYYSDAIRRKYLEEQPEAGLKIEYLCLLLEIKIGERNKYPERGIDQDDRKNIQILPQDDKFLSEAKAKIEKERISIGKIMVKYLRPSVLV